MTFTTPTLIEAELRAATAFSESTVPSLSAVTTWIEQTDDYIEGLASTKYGEHNYSETFNYSGEELLFVKHTPLISVSSVEYDNSDLGENPSFSTLAEHTQYKVDKDKGCIVLYPSKFSSLPKDGVDRFRVNYTAGYSSVPANVQMLATKLVANRVLESLINQNIDTRADGGSISVGDIKIVEPANYGVGSFKQLKSDIDNLKNEVVGGFKVYRYG